MRILYFDIDTLRPDHLGCYGYHRNTSPNIDAIASEGVRFDECHVSDAPCLPSRASMFTGMFGIHSGIVGHGGSAADIRPVGMERSFSTMAQRPGFIWQLRQAGLYPVSFSPFAERHSAWWFHEGWREFVNPGKGGGERADEVVPAAIDWLKRHGSQDNWFCHINIWDPHTPYRAPEDFGNPFADEPLEDWYTEEILRRQWDDFGPGTPQEPAGDMGRESSHPRQPSTIESMDDYKRWVDGYDCGIRYADEWFGKVLRTLEDLGVLDETVILITSDHGEQMGELNVIGDHATADRATCRVPMIVRFPGLPGGRADASLHYQNDIAATLVELAGSEVPAHWDGRSFADAFRSGESQGRDVVVSGQCCWSCQRSVRWDNWLFIRSYHTGLKHYGERMLFNVADDPHELHDLSSERPELADHGQALLERWTAEMMATAVSASDPMWLVMREGGPFHTRGDRTAAYIERLRQTGREHHADFLAKYPTGLTQVCV
ncbi:MAG: sulfatase family protein [Phycisphaerae bacterium]